jgi:hypothetical protein
MLLENAVSLSLKLNFYFIKSLARTHGIDFDKVGNTGLILRVIAYTRFTVCYGALE